MKQIDIPKFETKSELFQHLKDNEEDYIYQKKSITKQLDCITPSLKVDVQGDRELSAEEKFFGGVAKAAQSATEVKVRAIINTTKIMDSHQDVHIDGLWKRSLNNNKSIKMIQEHQMRLDKVIADREDLKAYTKEYTWKELGYDISGKTQALVFDATVKQSRNKFMFEQYKDGYVDNHSVGMRYVKIKLAINSEEEDYKEEKETYDKYISSIANKEDAEDQGYFWAVLEAKAIEGSAVVLGSNPITPTLTREKHSEPGKTQPDSLSLEEKELNKFFKI